MPPAAPLQAVFLFAAIGVDDYSAALAWSERLFGAQPAFHPSDHEAVWDLADHRSVVLERRPDRAGQAFSTILVHDLDASVAAIAARGIDPWREETYDNGVRKVIYRDAEGNEFGLGGSPD